MGRLLEVVPGILVASSEFAMTNTTVAVGADGGCLVIDPGVTVEELASLAAELAEAGLRVEAGFATHPHWDHVLWSRALGGVPRYAVRRAVTIATEERAAMVKGMERSASGHDLDLFGRLEPLSAAGIPWYGQDVQVIVHDGHAPGHGAVYFPESGVLVAGDMCSDVEMPLLDLDEPHPLEDYRTGLARLGALPDIRLVIPGHGHLGDAAGFRARLAADSRYLDLLECGREFDDPRCTLDWLRPQHEVQLRRYRR